MKSNVKPDAREAKTLGEACGNGDGTYNGFRLLSWLSTCVGKGKGVSEGEVKKIWESVRAKRSRRRS